jgi:hypothetical protein
MRRAPSLDARECARRPLNFNVKPAVGFTLPWAGVTPARSVKRKIAALRACSKFLGRTIPRIYFILGRGGAIGTRRVIDRTCGAQDNRAAHMSLTRSRRRDSNRMTQT